MKHILSVLFGCWLPFSSATAGIVLYEPNLPIPQTIDGLYLNVYTGATANVEPVDYNKAPWINPFFGGTFFGNGNLALPVITGTDQLLNLTPGTLVDAGSTFAKGEGGSTTHMGPAADQFQPGVAGYVGFAFQPGMGGSTYYGWANVMFDNTGAGTIYRYAYEDTAGKGIVTAAVPEPSHAILLLVGLACFAFRRRILGPRHPMVAGAGL